MGQTPNNIAICISGQFRGWRTVDKTFRKVLDAVNADVFIHTWDKTGFTSAYERLLPQSHIARLLIERSEKGNWIYAEDFPKRFPNLFSEFPSAEFLDRNEVVKQYQARDVSLEPFPDNFIETRELDGVKYPDLLLKAREPRRIFCMPMFYGIYHADLLRQEYEKKRGKPYSTVMRVRQDVRFQDPDCVIDLLKRDSQPENVIFTPDPIGRSPFVNDMVAIGGSAAITKYASLWANIHDYWNADLYPHWPFEQRSSEELLALHVETMGLENRPDIPFTFITLEKDRLSNRTALTALEKDLKLLKDATPKEHCALLILSEQDLANAAHEMTHQDLRLLLSELESQDGVGLQRFQELYFAKGVIYDRLKERHNALPYFERAHRRYREWWSEPGVNYARVLFNVGRVPEAISVASEIVARDPKHFIAWRNLGTYFRRAGQLDVAVAALETADEISAHKHPLVTNELIGAYEARKRESDLRAIGKLRERLA